MRVVIDTNVVVSGVFFGGAPRAVVAAAASGSFTACATPEFVAEYGEVVEELVARHQGHLRRDVLVPFTSALRVSEPMARVEACRDPDDNKFLGCAVDARALYIVSGDKDLLVLGSYRDVEIVTAREFRERFLGSR